MKKSKEPEIETQYLPDSEGKITVNKVEYKGFTGHGILQKGKKYYLTVDRLWGKGQVQCQEIKLSTDGTVKNA